MKTLFVFTFVTTCLAGIASADPISFSAAEGYSIGPLDGQPGVGSWSCTSNVSNSIFTVSLFAMAPHQDLLRVEISNEHGPSTEPVTPDYATKRMVPVTGAFEAVFSCRLNGQALTTDQSAIALGQTADSGWGPYFGLNKTSARSLAVYEGDDWTELVADLNASAWYDVEVTGDVGTGQFSVKVYDEGPHNANPSLGLLYEGTHSFRDSPTALTYVMLTNEGSGKDTSGGNHTYDDLDLTPEPSSLCVLAIGAIVRLRRRT